MTAIYVVRVEHNLVTALEAAPEDADATVPTTKLEIGTQLAQNFRVNGCIDGVYLFDNAQRARIFAVLCLEFTRALLDKRLEALKALRTGAEYRAPEDASADG